MPTISVIVPVYNVEKYIHRCVDSILGQTFEDFELILVDDGSPDNCGAICDEYAAKDSRVIVIHQENGGLSAARNAGIDWAFANSDSQWLTFVDSDDWIHPEYLQRLLDAAVQNSVSVSICGYANTDGQEPEIDQKTLLPVVWTPEDFFVAHNVNATIACAKLYRKECFAQIRYPLGKLHEDEFTTYKILFHFPAVVVIFAPLYCYFQNPASIIHQEFSIRKYDAIMALEERQSFFGEKYPALAEFTRMRRELLTARYSMMARKSGVYLQVPQAYKMGVVKTLRTIYKWTDYDQFQWIVYPYYPRTVVAISRLRKILSLFRKTD